MLLCNAPTHIRHGETTGLFAASANVSTCHYVYAPPHGLHKEPWAEPRRAFSKYSSPSSPRFQRKIIVVDTSHDLLSRRCQRKIIVVTLDTSPISNYHLEIDSCRDVVCQLPIPNSRLSWMRARHKPRAPHGSEGGMGL